MNKYAANIVSLKTHNRALLLNYIRHKPVSRAELAKITGLTKPAVTAIINELIHEGIVCEIGTGKTAKGRYPVLLDIVPDYRFSIGVLLNRKRAAVCISDLKCKVIDFIDSSISEYHSATQLFTWLTRSIKTLIEKNKLTYDKLLGIGVSSPGPLDYKAGIILNPPNLNILHNLPVVQMLKNEFKLPVCLENNAVLLGLAEYYNGCMNSFSNAIFITISYGIGSVIIENGTVYRGKSGYAGELGHISVNINGEKCPCGNIGCLELYASPAAIEREFGYSQDDFWRVIEAAYSGDRHCLEILDYEASYLSAGIVNAVNLLDIEAVILHGVINYRPELFISKLDKLIKERSFISKAHNIEILTSTIKGDADLISSTATLENDFFSRL